MKPGRDPDDIEGRVMHGLRVERFLIWLGYLVGLLGVLSMLWSIGGAVVGATTWSRAVTVALGVLAATVLSGATAYASGTNVGLAAVRLWRDSRK